jgi:hypothetical protein
MSWFAKHPFKPNEGDIALTVVNLLIWGAVAFFIVRKALRR